MPKKKRKKKREVYEPFTCTKHPTVVSIRELLTAGLLLVEMPAPIYTKLLYFYYKHPIKIFSNVEEQKRKPTIHNYTQPNTSSTYLKEKGACLSNQ